MTERNPVRDAVRYALTAGVAASFVGAPAAVLAQDDVAVQDKVTVTGSRIKRVDIEGPSPISVISREDIDATGDISVAEVLRGSSFNSFGSFKQRSGSSAQSAAAVSLRGLGSQRTLVLVDGRRITGAPSLGAGSATNLNTIPLELSSGSKSCAKAHRLCTVLTPSAAWSTSSCVRTTKACS